MAPKFSIVTVCFNEEKNICRTIDSVLSQTSHDYELIIQDGGSTDNTISIIDSYGLQYKSEPDKGIYDAMNKAIDRAAGEWLIFLNAGDYFYDDDILSKVESTIDKGDISKGFIYGDFIWKNMENGSEHIVASKPLHSLWKHTCFSHQALFIHKDQFLDESYDTSYSIAADYNHYYKAYINGENFQKVDFPISVMMSGGISEVSFYKRTVERFRIVFGSSSSPKVFIYYILIFLKIPILHSKLGHFLNRKIEVCKRWVVNNRATNKIRFLANQCKFIVGSVKKINKEFQPKGDFGSDSPCVSVIVPNYNNDKYIIKCIDSIRKQTYNNIEIIVVDDCSTDKSLEILEKIDDIRVIKNTSNLGVSKSRNKGILAANGVYITTLDGDDEFINKNKISNEMSLLITHENQGKDVVAYSNILKISRIGIPLFSYKDHQMNEGDVFAPLYLREGMIPRDFLCKKDLYIKAGLYDEGMSLYEDWDFKLRLALTTQFFYTGQLGVGYRTNPKGLSFADKEKHLNAISIVRSKYKDRCTGDE